MTHPSEAPIQPHAVRPSYPPAYGYSATPGYAVAPLGPGGAPLAGFADRLLARLIDGAIILIPMLLLEVIGALPIIVVAVTTNGQPQPALLAGSVVLSVALIIGLVTVGGYVYEVTLMHKTGQTYGKRFRRIRIVNAHDGGPIDKRMAVRRWLVSHVAGTVAPYFNYADGLWQLWDQPYRQCLHDKWPQTVVVKVNA